MGFAMPSRYGQQVGRFVDDGNIFIVVEKIDRTAWLFVFGRVTWSRDGLWNHIDGNRIAHVENVKGLSFHATIDCHMSLFEERLYLRARDL